MATFFMQQAGLLILGMVALAIGGPHLACRPTRLLVIMGHVYGAIVGLLWVFYLSAFALRPMTIFDWSLTPLPSSIAVYVGLSLLAGLLASAILELRNRDVRRTALRVGSIVAVYVCAIASVGLTLRIPFFLQALMDQPPP